MRMALDYGLSTFEVEISERKLVATRRRPEATALPDPPAAVAEALEHPIGYPALRRALTPDDHVAIVVDEQLPSVGRLLVPILEHISQAGVKPEAMTLLCPPSSVDQPWLDDLGDVFQESRIEVHDPTDRRHLAYLASTRHGRRIYINRTVVDADQVVVLTGRRYCPLLGYSGAEGALYPVLSDEATRQEVSETMSMNVPGKNPWPLRQEASEVAWLLGAPFLIQVIEGANSDILHVLGGPVETSGEGQRLLDERWRVEVDEQADVVAAGISGNPDRHTLADLGRAFACASRVVKPRGRIVLLCDAAPALGKEGDFLKNAESAGNALKLWSRQKKAGMETAYQWAHAAEHAGLYLLSKLGHETAEELFTFPLQNLREAQRIFEGEGTCLFLPDAHKTMAVVAKG
jgi:nickel-dependent lactate racemase